MRTIPEVHCSSRFTTAFSHVHTLLGCLVCCYVEISSYHMCSYGHASEAVTGWRTTPWGMYQQRFTPTILVFQKGHARLSNLNFPKDLIHSDHTLAAGRRFRVIRINSSNPSLCSSTRSWDPDPLGILTKLIFFRAGAAAAASGVVPPQDTYHSAISRPPYLQHLQ